MIKLEVTGPEGRPLTLYIPETESEWAKRACPGEGFFPQHEYLLSSYAKLIVDYNKSLSKSKDAYVIFAACEGEGFESLFKELGADIIVNGGIERTPSLEELLSEINYQPASTIVILPNSPAVMSVAEEAVKKTSMELIILPSENCVQGISAMLSWNSDLKIADAVSNMNESIKAAHCITITGAVKENKNSRPLSSFYEYSICLDGSMVGQYHAGAQLYNDLIQTIKDLDPQYITIYYGTSVNENDANYFKDFITSNIPFAEVALVYGGQPLHQFIIGLESKTEDIQNSPKETTSSSLLEEDSFGLDELETATKHPF